MKTRISFLSFTIFRLTPEKLPKKWSWKNCWKKCCKIPWWNDPRGNGNPFILTHDFSLSHSKWIRSFIIPESPRWLLCKGRTAEVATIIKRACVVNKREVPDNIEKLLRPPKKQASEKGCISLFSSTYLRLISFCFLIIWFTMNLVYYGLILNMNTFGGNVYLNSVSGFWCKYTR